MLRNPPGRKNLWKAQFLGPRPPLGLELSRYIPDSYLQKLTGHSLFRVRYIVIAVRKDAHAHETSGCSRSEVTRRESSSARVCLVENGEGERVEGSAQRVGAGGTLVARIFVRLSRGDWCIWQRVDIQILPSRSKSISLGFGGSRDLFMIGRRRLGF